MEGNFYRGSAMDQTSRFRDKEKKLLREMKFEKTLDTDVDIKKVKIDAIKPWITAKLHTLFGYEDDVVAEFVFSQLEKTLNPKVMQINLTGFLNARRAREFMGELWELLIEAQASEDGVPQSLVEKKLEAIKKTGSGGAYDDVVAIDLKDTSSNWNHRYQSLTYGTYKPKPETTSGDEVTYPSRHSPSFTARRRDRGSPSPPPRRPRRRSPSASPPPRRKRESPEPRKERSRRGHRDRDRSVEKKSSSRRDRDRPRRRNDSDSVEEEPERASEKPSSSSRRNDRDRDRGSRRRDNSDSDNEKDRSPRKHSSRRDRERDRDRKRHDSDSDDERERKRRRRERRERERD